MKKKGGKTGKKKAPRSRKMRVIKINVNSIETKKLEEAANVISSGGVIIYPTDTVYGIGASIGIEDAVKRVHRIKREREIKPLSIAVSGVSEIRKYAIIPAAQMTFIKKLLPGPITVLVEKRPPVFDRSGKLKEGVPDYISHNPKVGIRVPDARAILRLLKMTGPITSTSANITGRPSPWSASQVKIKADLLLDGGSCKTRKDSKIIDLVTGEIKRT